MKPYVLKLKMKMVESNESEQLENEVNDFLDSISGFGYELKEVDTEYYPGTAAEQKYISTIYYYQKFDKDPWDELAERQNDAMKILKGE